MSSLAVILSLAAGVWLLVIAWRDFWTLRISNIDVAIMCVIAIALRAAMGFPGGWADLAAGAILFALGFVFWLLRLMGAGDAKLYLPLGLLIGWDGLMAFAILLLPVSILVLGALALARRTAAPEGRIGQRLAEMSARRAVPYGVPMALSAIIVMILLSLA